MSLYKFIFQTLDKFIFMGLNKIIFKNVLSITQAILIIFF